MPLTRCFKCGRALTDPVSVRRGVGPECHQSGGLITKPLPVQLAHERISRATGLPLPRRSIRLHYSPNADRDTEQSRETRAHLRSLNTKAEGKRINGHLVSDPWADLFLFHGPQGRRCAVIICGSRWHNGRTARAAWDELKEAVHAYQTLCQEDGPTTFFLLEGSDLTRETKQGMVTATLKEFARQIQEKAVA